MGLTRATEPTPSTEASNHKEPTTESGKRLAVYLALSSMPMTVGSLAAAIFAIEAEARDSVHDEVCLEDRYDDGECRHEMAAREARGSLDDGLSEAAEALWNVVANAGGGDWSKESPEWQEGAARARSLYFAATVPLAERLRSGS